MLKACFFYKRMLHNLSCNVVLCLGFATGRYSSSVLYVLGFHTKSCHAVLFSEIHLSLPPKNSIDAGLLLSRALSDLTKNRS